MNNFCEISVDQLLPPKILLRPVKENSIEYLELKDSIESEGILNSILVKPSKDCADKYEIIDGMYRWTCAKEIGLQTIPTVIKHNVSDIDAIAMQIQANAIRPRTRPCEFAKQLKRIQKENPQISVAQIASIVSKSPMWVKQQLGLLALQRKYQKMVDRGEICLKNAYMLAKIPSQLRAHYVDQAKVLSATLFTSLASRVIKNYRESVRQNKLDAFFKEGFHPHAYLRSLGSVQEEYQSLREGALLVASENLANALDGWKAALRWVLHLDSESIEEQKQSFAKRRRGRPVRNL